MVKHPFQKTEPVDYQLLEKKRSTVIDNPDLDLVPWESVQHQTYSMAKGIDQKTLTVDNIESVKDLKSTHFSVFCYNPAGHQRLGCLPFPI
jgi:hypothetical protein